MLSRRHFVVMLFGLHPQFFHDRQHFAAQVLGRIDRIDREIAALDARTVAHIALGIDLGRVLRQFGRVESVAGVVRRDRPADIVEDEEFGFRAEIDRIADAGRLDIGQGLLGDRTRVAVIGLVGVGIHDIAEQEQRRLLVERVDIGRLQVGAQLHVRLVDRLPAGDRGAVEHGAVFEEVGVDQADVEGHVLHFAAHVGEAHVDILDVLVLDELENVCRSHVFDAPMSRYIVVVESRCGLRRRPGRTLRCECERRRGHRSRKSCRHRSCRARRRLDRFQGSRRQVIRHNQFDLDLRQKINNVLGPAGKAPSGPSGGRSPWPPARSCLEPRFPEGLPSLRRA